MRLLLKFIICLTLCGVLAFVYIDQFVNTSKHSSKTSRLLLKLRNENQKNRRQTHRISNTTDDQVVNIWCIFTKATTGSSYPSQLNILIHSIFKYSPNVPIRMHLLSDKHSEGVAKKITAEAAKDYKPMAHFDMVFYDIKIAVRNITDIVDIMTPYFSTKPGSYYSDSLFYLSLGLHRIAPLKHDKVILIDCDLQFRVSVEELYREFDKFSSTNLFGMTYELSTAYWYALYRHRKKNPESTFGLAVDENDKKNLNFPGFNSGVMLLHLDRIRSSIFYNDLLSKEVVEHFANKYQLKSQLGDQDYYTILGYDHPELFYKLDCGFNRQLCLWWRTHGNLQEFNKHFRCDSDVKIYHANCNSTIPNNYSSPIIL